MASIHPDPFSPECIRKLKQLFNDSGRWVFLTGAGISAESRIPTFRGKDGYWTVGSKEYHPQEMATRSMFSLQPEEVWSWYLYRRTICRSAKPNPGHLAIVKFESLLQDRFLLVTQNVDGLHLRAGNTVDRTFQIHGNIDFVRCINDCHTDLLPLPDALPSKTKGSPLTDEERALLKCSQCGDWLRPHVLWFDECYDEAHFRFRSALEAAHDAKLLLVVGSAGATNLPMQMSEIALRSGACLIDINPEDNPFRQMTQRAECGFSFEGESGIILPKLLAALRSAY